MSPHPARLYHLPGRRFAVSRLRELPRAILAAVVLLGVMPLLLNLVARTGSRTWQHRMERAWARVAVSLLGIDLRIGGLENVDQLQAYVVVPLHEGFADIIALLHLPVGLRFVARDELTGWQILGKYLRASGQIVVDPESPVASYRRLLAAAPGVLAGGESVVVFAQGTILGIESAFSPGAFRVAERLERPVLPVVLSGAHRVWDHPFSPRVRFGQKIRLEILPPIPPESATSSMAGLQVRMKQQALTSSPGPRRFVPERDGWWDEYRYEIDPTFTDLLQRVESHRAALKRSTQTSD